MAYKTKTYAKKGGSSWNSELIELKKVGLNRKTFETKIGVERDAIGRIVLYDKEGKVIGRKPKDIVEIDGKTYYDDE